jgi:DNA-binding CsgD family transcriptional regulator
MRPGPDRRAELVERVYDAAFDDAALEQLSANLGEALGVEQVLVSSRRGREMIDLAILGPPRAMEDYAAHYWRIDPWTPAILGVAPGRFAFGDELVPTAVVKESEFYNDFARPQGVLFPMGGRLMLDSETYLNISINRPGAAPAFREADRSDLAELAGHVRRMLQLRRRFEPVRTYALTSAAVDGLSFGLALTGADGKLLFANRALEALAAARQGVSLAGGRLAAAAHREADRLASLIFDAAHLRRGGAGVLSGPDGEPCVSAIVTPAAQRNPFGTSDAGELALVAVSPLRATPTDAGAMLSRLFALSDAESEIVAALWRGEAPQAIAERRNVRPTTLKSQLDAIYRKSGVANQRELMRLLAGAPQIRFKG